MKTLLAIFAALFFGSLTLLAEEGTRIVVYLLDPRVVTHTKSTMPIGWGDRRTDLIGSRTLSVEQSAKLEVLLKEELSPSTEVPFCGHAPGYAVRLINDEKEGQVMSLCGLCATWAYKGELRVLAGTRSLAFLQEVLPLPKAFQHVKKLPDLMKIDRKVPFHKLKAVE